MQRKLKGVELHVNVLVIISIAVLVMLGLIALYVTGIIGAAPLQVQLAKNAACSELINRGCQVTDPATVLIKNDINGDTTVDENDNLQALCEKSFGVTPGDQVACRKICSCPGLS